MEKKYKGSAQRLSLYFESSRDKWRERSEKKQREKRALTYEVRDLRASVSNWKARCQAAEAKLKSLEKKASQQLS